MNWFVLAIGVLQFMGAVCYLMNGAVKMGAVYICFAVTSFIFYSMPNQ